VVSRNIGEFVAAGVPVFDPWDSLFHWGVTAVKISAPVTLDALMKAAQRKR
jgi:hypothetical protein